jgi:hypothetical protein
MRLHHERICEVEIINRTKNTMNDYREYKTFYKYVGFFVLIAGVFTIAFKLTTWVVWAHECINASL